MRLFFIQIGIMVFMSACHSQNSKPLEKPRTDLHKVIAEEVLQATNYTYLRVKEDGEEKWLALPKFEAQTGKTYYYRGGFLMTEFKSKDLDRTFDQIYFLERISEEPTEGNNAAANIHAQSQKTKTEKKAISVAPPEGGISIAELYENKTAYEGKTVKVRGQVTKYTAKVMGKNWIHIQDGTEYDHHFDLTVTSDSEIKVGQVAGFEGKVSLNKDFGYGYYYDVLLEKAKMID